MTGQTAQVYELLKAHGYITRLMAMGHGITNVTARIADLRLRHSVSVKCDKSKDSSGKLVSKWSLA